MTEAALSPQKKAIWGWCAFDWANSAFTTLVVTFIYSAYFSQAFAPDEQVGTELWSRGVTVSAISVALLSPVLGAMADRAGKRRAWLLLSSGICIVGTVALAFVRPGAEHSAFLALTVFVIANVAFEVANVFYNAFLPALAPPDRVGRISGYGWALGYAGGLVCLAVALLGFVGLPGSEPLLPLGQEDGFHVRATNLLVAGWFLLFSIPLFLWVPEPPALAGSSGVMDAFRELGQTLRHLRRFKEIVKLLAARLVYNDGLVTIFTFGGIYAAGTFGMDFGEIIIFGIVLNLTAGLGAWGFGFVDDRLGGKVTILITLVALALAATLGVLAPDKTWFWVAGILIGIFAGPNQSASRSLMARFVPEKHQSEFFGFFAFSGKATAFLGPLLLGRLSGAYGQRVGVSVVVVFFVIGALVLLTVSEPQGIREAEASQ